MEGRKAEYKVNNPDYENFKELIKKCKELI